MRFYSVTGNSRQIHVDGVFKAEVTTASNLQFGKVVLVKPIIGINKRTESIEARIYTNDIGT